jgi:NADPH-dependent glutamate synthase beta subunit-like oxidoreductase
MSEYGDAIDEVLGQDDSIYGQTATAQAVAGVDADPDSAARAIQLARHTRVPAPIING